MVRVFFGGVLTSVAIALCSCSGSVVGGDGGEGGDDGGGGTVTPGNPKPSNTTISPPKKCETYVTTWCNRSLNCYVKVGRLAEKDLQYNLDQCKKRVINALPCSAVTSTSGTYSQCIADIKSMACARWDVPMEQFANVAEPLSCEDLLSF